MTRGPGTEAPEFSLDDDDGNTVTLAGLRGKWVVLFFYPRDDTPGCTVEAQKFSDLLPLFRKKRAVVYGISMDDHASHRRFIEKCSLQVPLLSDPLGDVVGAFDCLVERNMYGKTYVGVSRTTFLISPEGIIEKVWENVQPRGHAQEVLDSI